MCPNYCAEAKFILHQCVIIQSEMIHFIRQLQYYLQFEVMECSWDILVSEITDGAKDLDHIIESHQKYLNSISSKALVSSDQPNQLLLPKVQKLFDAIVESRTLEDRVYVAVLGEHERRLRIASRARTQLSKGVRSGTEQDEAANALAYDAFLSLIPTMSQELMNVSSVYRVSARTMVFCSSY